MAGSSNVHARNVSTIVVGSKVTLPPAEKAAGVLALAQVKTRASIDFVREVRK